MARLALLLMFTSLLLATTNAEPEHLPPTHKLTHLHFYLHDTFSGNKPTGVRVAEAPTTNSSLSLFGMVVVVDDPLTVGPTPDSEEIGRAQGFLAAADQKNFALLIDFNLVFTKGTFSGSTLSMFGRNPILETVREMPIIGGTGAFRFGRGYAQVRTVLFNASNGDAIVDYNVYVWH